MKIKYIRLYRTFENSIRRTKGYRRRWNAYTCWVGTGKFYRRGPCIGQEKDKLIARIIGERGEWYRIVWKLGGFSRFGPFKTRDEAATAKEPRGSNPRRKPTRKFYGVRRGYGDDLYSWTVYDKRTGRTILDGESRHQAGYYADKFEKEATAKEPKSCGCKKPKSSRDCMYCGTFNGGLICGVCAEAGIDHDESLPNRGIVRGTERRTCKQHQEQTVEA